MKRKMTLGLLCALALLVACGGALSAQRTRVQVGPETRTTVWNWDGGGARLGVRLEDVNAEKMKDLKLSSEGGAVVTEVEEDSAAAKAGLKSNDVIMDFDGERVRSTAQLRRMVQETPAGRTVAVKISRAGGAQTLHVKLEEGNFGGNMREFAFPQVEVPEIHMPEMNFDFFNGAPRLGVSADDLTKQLAENLGVAQGSGVLVLEVTPGSPAEKAGLKAGDCITKVGDEKVESVSDLHRALGRNSGSDEKRDVAVTIVRDHHEQTLTVQVEASHRRIMTTPRRTT
ncbi:MAG TPA: PDZ domain-containing protein [Terriglobia bacterium]|nr:PDZ domain-containing protein [Terriglobia bacterium]